MEEKAKENAPEGGGGNWVYLLRCADGSLYCGWTNALSRRMKAHREGKASKYTRTRLPAELVYTEEYPTKHEAMRREVLIKRMTRQEKLRLCGLAAQGGADKTTQ